MMRSKKALICFLLIGLSSTMLFSQWVKPKGKGYYKLSAWYLEYDQHFTDTGEKDPNVTRGNFNVNFYGDYGITDKLDLIAYIPFFSRTFQNEVRSGTTGELITSGEAVNAIGDIDLGVEYGILNAGNLALSGSLILGLPTGDSSGGSDGSYQTGDGEFNQFVKLNIGIPFSLANAPMYSKTYAGFNNRTKDFSDEFRTGLEIGINVLNNKLWIIGKSDVVKSLKNGNLNAQNNQGNIFANNIEYVSLGGEAAYYITEKLGVSLNYTSAVSGRIISAHPSYSGGIFLDIK
ncbi:hypothetical protein OE09_0091 [Flavobacteriaceae bacterium MAR_2010_72]|nr:hypothetical protein OE09_0091 [Flavobacteriaceae bacterium MAR_2010_72]TVZ58205.1 hypothetical protein NA63_0701 [Flavobacteriaceae bacterium MAR_2010_105]